VRYLSVFSASVWRRRCVTARSECSCHGYHLRQRLFSAAAKPWHRREERAVGQHLCSAQCFSSSGGGAETPQVFPCRVPFGWREGVRATPLIVSDFLAAGKWRHAGTSERRARNLVGGDGSSGLGGSRKFAHGPARNLEYCLRRMGHCSLR